MGDGFSADVAKERVGTGKGEEQVYSDTNCGRAQLKTQWPKGPENFVFH